MIKTNKGIQGRATEFLWQQKTKSTKSMLQY